MRKITAIIAIGFFLVLCNALSPSRRVGTTAFPLLLKMDAGAKATALGGAWVGWARSAEAFAANPAASAFIKNRGANASFANFWGLFNYGFAGYYHTFNDNNTAAIGFSMVSYGSDFVRTDDIGNEIGKFAAGDLSMIVNYARKIGKNIAIGISAKPLYSSADTFSAIGLCADVGGIMKMERDKARIGFVVSNIGKMISSYGDEKYPLPLTAKLGGSYILPGFPGTFGAQIETGYDIDFLARAGIELDFLKPVFLRVGYALKPHAKEDPSDMEKLNGLSAGMGFDYRFISFNYALQHYGVLGMVHKFDLSYWGF